jgi:hypothetical protein
VGLLRRALQRRRASLQETVEHPARSLTEPHVILTIKDPLAVDEDAVRADRTAQRAGATAGQVVDAARFRNPDRRRIKQSQVDPGTRRDMAAIGNATRSTPLGTPDDSPNREARPASVAACITRSCCAYGSKRGSHWMSFDAAQERGHKDPAGNTGGSFGKATGSPLASRTVSLRR